MTTLTQAVRDAIEALKTPTPREIIAEQLRRALEPKQENPPREPDAREALADEDPQVIEVARAIAEQGFGRPWDDFLPLNAHDTDQGDLIEYARAAVAALRQPAAPGGNSVNPDKCPYCSALFCHVAPTRDSIFTEFVKCERCGCEFRSTWTVAGGLSDDWSCGTCGDRDVPEKFRVFGSCYICAAGRSVAARDRKIESLKRSALPSPPPSDDYPFYSATITWIDEDQAYIGSIPELPGCTACGETPEACIKELRDAKAAWIEACNAAGNPVPPPRECLPSDERARAVEGPAETWAYIERLLHDECGLMLDCGLDGQRANCINAIKNGLPDPALISAAIEFLNSGEGLHKIRVNGRMMDRKAVALALSLTPPTESELRQARENLLGSEGMLLSADAAAAEKGR